MATATLDFPTTAPADVTLSVPTVPVAAKLDDDLVHQLQAETGAVRFFQKKFGVRRALNKAQLEQAAATFDAQPEYLSGSKKLIDTRHKAYQRVIAIQYAAKKFWRAHTVPYPEAGIRLVRKSRIPYLVERFNEFRADLEEARSELQAALDELKATAREVLQDLYNPDDYPTNVAALFDIDWDFQSIAPPEYLKQINPDLYEQQKARIAAKFDEAVAMTEQALVEELHGMVEHLFDRLNGVGENGKPKVFYDTAVTKLTDFFARFKELNISNNRQLDELVEQAQQLVHGVTPKALRKDVTLRQTLAEGLNTLKGQLDTMLVDKPRRAISLEEDDE